MSKIKYGTVVGISDSVILESKEYTKICTKCGRMFETTEGWQTLCPICEQEPKRKKSMSAKGGKPRLTKMHEKELQKIQQALQPNIIKNDEYVVNDEDFTVVQQVVEPKIHYNNHDTVEYQQNRIKQLLGKIGKIDSKIKLFEMRINALKEMKLVLQEEVNAHEKRIDIVKKYPSIFK